MEDVLLAYEYNIANPSIEEIRDYLTGDLGLYDDELNSVFADKPPADVDEPEEKWPLGRLVGATVRLRWPDGMIDQFRLVAGDDEFGNGRDRISIASPLGKAITNAEVGDSLPFEAPGGASS